MVVYDNVVHQIKSAQLSKALTAEIWADRILGRNASVSLPVNCSWIATGNNIRLGGDIPRRCYWVQMDAKCARPSERTGFRHNPLKDWVRANRPALVSALLTLARAWFAADCPTPAVPVLGSFES